MTRPALLLAASAAASFAAPALAQDEGSGWSIEPFGRVQFDIGHVDGPDALAPPVTGTDDEFRRIRIGLQGDMPGGFGYKVEVDFAESDIALTDALISYETGDVEFVIGQHNNFQSLEELTSSRFTSFMERAAFTDAFGFERRIGASAQYAHGDWRVNAGVFSDDLDGLLDDENDGWSVDTRVVYAPRIGNARLHLGGSAHWRDLENSGTVRYRERALVHANDTRFVATPALPATGETSLGLEAAYIAGRFHAAGEAHWLHASLAGTSDPTFFGGYAEIGLFLTDDSRGYSGGRFNRTTPTRPITRGGIGAVQINLRFDHLDLSDAGIVGGRQNAYVASLVWTPIGHARLMLNYGHVDFADAAVPAGADRDYGVDVFGVRAEFDF